MTLAQTRSLLAPALGVVLLHVQLNSDADVLQSPQRSGAGLQSGGRQLHKDPLPALLYRPGAQGRRGVHQELVNDVLPERAELLEAVLLGLVSRPMDSVGIPREGCDTKGGRAVPPTQATRCLTSRTHDPVGACMSAMRDLTAQAVGSSIDS